MHWNSWQRGARYGAFATAVAGVLFALTGCAGWDIRGTPFKDEPKIGRKPAEGALTPNRGASLYGFSNKARQIEKNLGVE